ADTHLPTPSVCSDPPSCSALVHCHYSSYFVFFFNDTPPTEISTLSLHDALPISRRSSPRRQCRRAGRTRRRRSCRTGRGRRSVRSEEHTSELQSPYDLVCRLLLEKKKKHNNKHVLNKESITTEAQTS